MATIKRVKGGRTHYATAVAPAGNVTAWTDKESQATQFDGELLASAKAFHAAKASDPNLGAITIEGEKAEPPKPVVVADAAPLEPVGVDADGSVKPVGQLGHKPHHHGHGKK